MSLDQKQLRPVDAYFLTIWLKWTLSELHKVLDLMIIESLLIVN
jgi:hypothetical protein